MAKRRVRPLIVEDWHYGPAVIEERKRGTDPERRVGVSHTFNKGELEIDVWDSRKAGPPAVRVLFSGRRVVVVQVNGKEVAP